MSTPGPYPPPDAYPPPAPPPYAPAPAPARRSRPVDVTVTIVLIVLLALLGLVSLAVGLFSVMASDGCFDDRCADRVAIAVLLIELAPIVAWVPTTVWAIVRMVRGRIAFWVPLLALPIWLGFVVWGFTYFPS